MSLAPSTKQPRRTPKGMRRARQILEIAEKLFQRQGYAQTTMDDIARATGLLKGSLYYYVASKEDLLYEIVDDVHEVARRQLDAALALEGVSAVDRLLHFVEAQVRYNAEHVTRVGVYHHEWHRLEGERHREVKERRRSYNAALTELVAEADAHGQLTVSGDIRAVTMTVLAVICWPYTWYREDLLPADELVSVCTEFVRGALRVVPHDGRPTAGRE